MLKRARWYAIVSLLAIIAASIIAIILQDAPPPSAPTATLHKATEQKRIGVRKDIWFSEGEDRLHYRINAPRSLLMAIPKQNGYEVIEKMEGIECLLQESFSRDGQQLRYFKANEGIYRYANHEFLASSVLVSLFTAGGHDLPDQPSAETYMKGLAKQVSLSLGEAHPNFRAEEFKAHIRPSAVTHGP